jgi:hypothetical protein
MVNYVKRYFHDIHTTLYETLGCLTVIPAYGCITRQTIMHGTCVHRSDRPELSTEPSSRGRQASPSPSPSASDNRLQSKTHTLIEEDLSKGNDLGAKPASLTCESRTAKMVSVDASQLTAQELRPYVQQGLKSLRKGEYFTEFGLSEDEVILEDGAKLPDKSDKRSLFFSFLTAVATSIVKEQGIEKKKKKFIKEVMDRLQAFQDQWAALLLGKEGDAAALRGGGDVAEKASSVKRDKKVENGTPGEEMATPKPAKKASKKRKLKEELIDSDDGEELLDDTPAVKKESVMSIPGTPIVRNAASQGRWLERKANFEAQCAEVLDEVPETVKQRFGQIFFSKWGKEILPVLVLSPFDAPPGPMREMWFDMQEKV